MSKEFDLNDYTVISKKELRILRKKTRKPVKIKNEEYEPVKSSIGKKRSVSLGEKIANKKKVRGLKRYKGSK